MRKSMQYSDDAPGEDFYDDLKNTGFLTIGTTPGSWRGRPRTIIVLGAQRSGTSMVAGALHHLGVFLGDDFHSPVFEDLRMGAAIKGGSWKTVREVIGDYDGRHEVWGYKRPVFFYQTRGLGLYGKLTKPLHQVRSVAIHNFLRFHQQLRSPLYVVTFKDVFSIANRNRISMDENIQVEMARAIKAYRWILSIINRLSPDALLVSAEKAVDRKDQFLETLIDYCGLEPSSSQQAAALDFIVRDSRSYLINTKSGISTGQLDVVTRHSIQGWARYKNHEEVATVALFINDVEVGRTQANRFRSDLQGQVHSKGTCGFEFSTFDASLLGEGSVVRARVVDDSIDIANSPLEFSVPSDSL